MNGKKGNFLVNMSHSLLPQKGPFLSCTTVTLTAARMFIKIRNMGNCHYYSHNITLADKTKSHGEETGNETRKQVPELFLQI